MRLYQLYWNNELITQHPDLGWIFEIMYKIIDGEETLPNDTFKIIEEKNVNGKIETVLKSTYNYKGVQISCTK